MEPGVAFFHSHLVIYNSVIMLFNGRARQILRLHISTYTYTVWPKLAGGRQSHLSLSKNRHAISVTAFKLFGTNSKV